jgi:hypothetical protein
MRTDVLKRLEGSNTRIADGLRDSAFPPPASEYYWFSGGVASIPIRYFDPFTQLENTRCLNRGCVLLLRPTEILASRSFVPKNAYEYVRCEEVTINDGISTWFFHRRGLRLGD